MVTKAVGLRRILKLADYVEKIKPSRFNFEFIVGWDWKGKPDLSCGTTACALGWATTMPLFRKLGLCLDRLVIFNGTDDWESIAPELFGINYQAMMALFQPNLWDDDYGNYGDYPYLLKDATPKQWAKHARKIVEILRKED